ncbi:MAG: hypothetical protein U0531_14420 [Dehalococcoidia bacterium]
MGQGCSAGSGFPGVWRIITTADPSNRVAESDETNNMVVTRVDVLLPRLSKRCRRAGA